MSLDNRKKTTQGALPMCRPSQEPLLIRAEESRLKRRQCEHFEDQNSQILQRITAIQGNVSNERQKRGYTQKSRVFGCSQFWL